MAVFKRNLTSELIEKTCVELVLADQSSGRSLEIGCGDFNISRNLARHAKDWSFCGSDISQEAIDQATKLSMPDEFDLRVGSLFDPWHKEKFDLIISDVASISSKIAVLSDWYQGIPYDTGADGLKQVGKLLPLVASHMRVGGCFVIPYISLSNYEKQKDMLSDIFCRVTYHNQVDWPVPKKIIERLSDVTEYKSSSNYLIKELFGMHIAFTGVAVAYNS